MSRRSPKQDDTSAQALRAAGYVPLPRLWVTPEDLEIIIYMAEKHSSEVTRIRCEARAEREAAEAKQRASQRDKQWEIEQAWSSR